MRIPVMVVVAWLAPGCAGAADSADARAAAVVAGMTPAEQVGVVHGVMALPLGPGFVLPAGALIGAGFVPGVARVGFPALRETDASLGVAYVQGLRHDGATALPSGLATAASFDASVAYDGGAVAGREARLKGFNVLLGGGVDLARDPRNGRNFEYLGEDPLLAGTLAGAAVRGTQDQHVVSTIKHFALNDQETLRNSMNAVIAPAAARESDLLAFEIALREGHPGSVMCAYNRVNGPFACDSDWLLNQVLKRDWGFTGWVMSDWGAVHDTGSALHGLDQESGAQLDRQVYFGAPLLAAAGRDAAVAARLADMTRRIARAAFAVGADVGATGPVDVAAGRAVALRGAEEGMVLLRNQGEVLPLGAGVRRIAVIGGHADAGVLSGGGSSQVAPDGGPAVAEPVGGEGMMAAWRQIDYQPSSPVVAIKRLAPWAEVHFDDGRYPSAAAALARRADVAIVFATQWMMEGYDAPDLSLPEGQDALIAAVAAANPNTIVVLETGGPVLMPWLDKVRGVVEAWYPGAAGGEAIAAVLMGRVSPSGRLPVSFPASVAQLPRPELPGLGMADGSALDVAYPEGSDVGYRWYAARRLRPLFPFGFGLSYSRFSYRGLVAQGGAAAAVRFTVTNTGGRAAAAVAQVYLTRAPARAQQRLVGWARVALKPGESRQVTVPIAPLVLADWDEAGHGWRRAAGAYRLAVGESAADLRLTATVPLDAQTLPP